MQFLIKDLEQDVLCVTVLDRDYFSPNGTPSRRSLSLKVSLFLLALLNRLEFLGRTEVRVSDIAEELKTNRGPLVKRLPLYEVASGEIILKLDLQLFNRC